MDKNEALNSNKWLSWQWKIKEEKNEIFALFLGSHHILDDKKGEGKGLM